jgi:hypothetical protein
MRSGALIKLPESLGNIEVLRNGALLCVSVRLALNGLESDALSV